jgi:RNA polymerase sigma factor (sigma-70 family)
MVTKSSLAAWFSPAAGEADFEALYRAELPRVYNFFRYRVGDEALAEDLTSETFERAWRHRARYRRDLAAFSTWLFSIARNVAIDYYHKRRAELSLDDSQIDVICAAAPYVMAMTRRLRRERDFREEPANIFRFPE